MTRLQVRKRIKSRFSRLKRDAENYSATKNKQRLKRQRSKIKTTRRKMLDLSKEHAEKFTHALPTAGADMEELAKADPKEKMFSKETTFYGRETKTGLPWQSIRDHVKSFDVIGFHGGDGVSSFIGAVQQKVAGSKTAGAITHVGFIIRGEDFPKDHDLYAPGRVFCWESTMSGPLAFDGVRNVDGSKCFFFRMCDCCGLRMPSVPHRFGFLGSQFRDMDELAIRYDSNPNAKLVWCKLNAYNRKKVDTIMTPENLNDLMDWWNGLSYNSTCCCLDLCAAVFDVFRWLQQAYTRCCPRIEHNGAQFCSEFVASIYQQLELLPDTVVANKVVPADYLVIKDAASGEWKGLDQDDDVPPLFDSYWRFTPRSKIGDVKLKKSFVDSMTLDKIKDWDEAIITEAQITEDDVEDVGVQTLTSMPLAGEAPTENVSLSGVELDIAMVPKPELPYPKDIAEKAKKVVTQQPQGSSSNCLGIDLSCKSETGVPKFNYPKIALDHTGYVFSIPKIESPAKEVVDEPFQYPSIVMQHHQYLFKVNK